MKRMLVLGASIIAASAIIGLDKINDIKQFGNVIELTSGKIRLGEVYRETLSSTYEVTFVGDDRPTTSVQSNTKNLYSSAFEEFKNTIDQINKSREGVVVR
ncbi:hypothetical protein [Vibrio metoecus]|uniref:hypothetical protein n=1 Tax=Vibrio metoecus TaxID=1481663 RepID=UPI0013024ED2|nr:hypothetical protein [Vibrio metoecus]